MSRLFQLWGDVYSGRQLKHLLALSALAVTLSMQGADSSAAALQGGVLLPALAAGFVKASGQRLREVAR